MPAAPKASAEDERECEAHAAPRDTPPGRPRQFGPPHQKHDRERARHVRAVAAAARQLHNLHQRRRGAQSRPPASPAARLSRGGCSAWQS